MKRRDAGVAWTSPAGRTWSSPSQHEPPAPLPTAHLSETEVDEELWRLLGRPDDGPEGYELRAQDVAPVADDETWRRLVDGGTRWTLDLDDSDSWRDPEPSTSA